jgi:hypothetical protein
VVTSLRSDECKAKYLYEKVYCARGDMENRIKECQLDLYADRTSTATMRADQLRLWFASMACVLICALRRIGLHDTDFAKATCGTIRLKLLKIGAIVADAMAPVRSPKTGPSLQSGSRLPPWHARRQHDTKSRDAAPYPGSPRSTLRCSPQPRKCPSRRRVFRRLGRLCLQKCK